MLNMHKMMHTKADAKRHWARLLGWLELLLARAEGAEMDPTKESRGETDLDSRMANGRCDARWRGGMQ